MSAFDDIAIAEKKFEETQCAYKKVQIDFMRVKDFLSQMNNAMTGRQFMQQVLDLIDLIDFEIQQERSHTKIMCVRGLLMLMHLESFSDFEWQHITYDILGKLNKILKNVKATDQLSLFIKQIPAEQLKEILMNM